MTVEIEKPLTVTVCVPCIPFQREEDLQKCLKYINEQSVTPIQLLVMSTFDPMINAIEEAVKEATGDIFILVDDDSDIPQNNWIQCILNDFQKSKDIAYVGGSVTQRALTESEFEKHLVEVQNSFLGFFLMSRRYSARHRKFSTNPDPETLIAMGGYRTEFLKSAFAQIDFHDISGAWENIVFRFFQKSGKILIYDPMVSYFHRPRNSPASYARQIFGYGKGRAFYFRHYPNDLLRKPYFLLPSILLVTMIPGIIWPVPVFGLYLVAILGGSMVTFRQSSVVSAFTKAGLIVITHLAYGLGFLKGLIFGK